MTQDNVAHVAEPPTKNAVPQIVSVSVGTAQSGRLPVVVAVVPVVDLDAIGVFVDLRRTSKDPSDLPTIVEGPDKTLVEVRDLSALTAGHERRRGDDAVEALAREEAGDQPHADTAAAEHQAEAEPPELMTEPRGNNLKRGWLSSQIARSVKLTVGQAESFRADIALPPPAPPGESWYIRGRFAASTGQGLRSGWQRLA